MADIQDVQVSLWCRTCGERLGEFAPYVVWGELARDLEVFILAHRHRVTEEQKA